MLSAEGQGPKKTTAKWCATRHVTVAEDNFLVAMSVVARKIADVTAAFNRRIYLRATIPDRATPDFANPIKTDSRSGPRRI